MLLIGLSLAISSQTLSFNDMVIEMLVNARKGQIVAMSEAEAIKKGFSSYNAYVTGFSFSSGGESVRHTRDQSLIFETLESQDILCEGIVKKLKVALPSSQLKERGGRYSREPYHLVDRYFALEAIVDGVQSLENAIGIVVDFSTGNIISGYSNKTPDNRYIRFGHHLTDAEAKDICRQHGIEKFKLSRIWYPFNFVCESKASTGHDHDLAVATFAIYQEGTKQKSALINDLGEYDDTADMNTWSIQRAFGKARTGPPSL